MIDTCMVAISTLHAYATYSLTLFYSQADLPVLDVLKEHVRLFFAVHRLALSTIGLIGTGPKHAVDEPAQSALISMAIATSMALGRTMFFPVRAFAF
jgi:hypothetical protein